MFRYNGQGNAGDHRKGSRQDHPVPAVGAHLPQNACCTCVTMRHRLSPYELAGGCLPNETEGRRLRLCAARSGLGGLGQVGPRRIGMEYSDKALILAVKRFREIDAWVRLLSPTRGVYTAFAFGGSKAVGGSWAALTPTMSSSRCVARGIAATIAWPRESCSMRRGCEAIPNGWAWPSTA